MEYLLLLIGLLLLAGLSFIIYKMNTDDSDKTNDSTEELDKIKEILGLEFKNLANEIFDEKTKKIMSDNSMFLFYIMFVFGIKHLLL